MVSDWASTRNLSNDYAWLTDGPRWRLSFEKLVLAVGRVGTSTVGGTVVRESRYRYMRVSRSSLIKVYFYGYGIIRVLR